MERPNLGATKPLAAMHVARKGIGRINAKSPSFGVISVAQRGIMPRKCVDGVPKKGGPNQGQIPKQEEEVLLSKEQNKVA